MGESNVANYSKILLVEDDANLRAALLDTLNLAGYSCIGLASAEEALIAAHEMEFGLIVSDVKLQGMQGNELLVQLQRNNLHVPLLLMTAYGSIASAVQAMRAGAVDYLIKPFEPKELLSKIKQFCRTDVCNAYNPIAKDLASKQLFRMALKFSVSEATVLLTGPSGSGKEVMARYIHANSSRAEKPFVAINCAAIPENMLEATLFGYEKGAFTGAYQASMGKFEQAQGGTLLLDEISEMDLSLQAKLLRVLQEREVERLGSKKIIQLDVRILATSNRNLHDCVIQGDFREDLFYRLNVLPLHCLALIDRPDDIMPLVDYLSSQYAKLNDRVVPSFSLQAQQLLREYAWPGNVREMENVIQRALLLQSGMEIQASDIRFESMAKNLTYVTHETSVMGKMDGLSDDLKSREHALIIKALDEAQGNRKKVADKLGISERTLRYKLARMREQGLYV